MRKSVKKYVCIGILLLLLFFPQGISAATTNGTEGGALTGELTDELLGELELSELEQFLQEERQDGEPDIGFAELLRGFLSGETPFDLSYICTWIGNRCLSVLDQNRTYLVQMLVLILSFAMLQGISGIFQDAFLSEISFLAVYFLFLYQTVRIFLTMQQSASQCLSRISDFTLLVQPVFCMSLLMSSGARAAGFGYEILLLVLYLVETVLEKVLLPLVFIFLITQFANFAWREERFSSMAKLLSGGITLAQKLLVTFVLGINVIQGMVSPAIDRLRHTAGVRVLGALPGVGGVVNAVSEMLLGTGLLIKNCVGAAVLVLLVLLCARPVLEIGVLTLIYRVLAAVAEPVTDKRISGVLGALARAGMLYLKLVVAAVLMLFLSVAIVCVASGEV